MFTNKLACLVKLFSSENAGTTRLVKAWNKKKKTYIQITCWWERGEEKLLRFFYAGCPKGSPCRNFGCVPLFSSS